MNRLYAWIGSNEIAPTRVWDVEALAVDYGVPVINIQRMILKDHPDYWVRFREQRLDPHFHQPRKYAPLKHGFCRTKSGNVVEVWQTEPTFAVWQVVIDEDGNWVKGSNPREDYKIRWMKPDGSFFAEDCGIVRIDELVPIVVDRRTVLFALEATMTQKA